MKRFFSFAALTVFSLALARPVAAQLPHYTISDSGVIPFPQPSATIADVTRTGYALENYSSYPGPPYSPEMYHATMFVTRNGVVVFTADLGIPSPAPGSGGGFARKISDDGTTIGNYGGYEYPTTGFIYPLGQISPNVYTRGDIFYTYNAINNQNKIAGTYTDLKFTGYWHAVAGTGLGLPGDSNSEANGISEAGLIVGASGSGFNQYVYQAPPLVKHAFVWTPTTPNGNTGSSRALSPLNAGENAEAYAVNDLGEAVGTSGAANVYWNRAGTASPLSFAAKAINNKSQILSGAGRIGSPGGALLNPITQIVNPYGWSALVIYKLYNDGALVGTGLYGGATHIFLLTPVPTSISGKVTLEGAVNPAQTATFTLRPTNGAASTTVTQTLGADGSFSLPNVSPDNYSLLVRVNLYLQKAVSVSAVSANAANIALTLPAGDANNDNSVDATDFGILVSAYNTDASIAGSGYDANADFNGDGLVDATDFNLFVTNYNTTGDL